MRHIDNLGSDTGAENFNINADIEFDAFAEMAREKDVLLLAVQRKLMARGYNFVTIDWLKRVFRNSPELTVKALCSTSSISRSESHSHSQETSFAHAQSPLPEGTSIPGNSAQILHDIGNADSLNVSSENHNPQVQLVAEGSIVVESVVPSTPDAKITTVFEKARSSVELAAAARQRDLPASSSSISSSRASAEEPGIGFQKSTDSPNGWTHLRGRRLFSHPMSGVALRYNDQPRINGGDKIPVTVVEFSNPNDVLVRRCDLNFTLEEMSKFVTLWYSQLGDTQNTFKCSPTNLHIGLPVLFIGLDGCKRAIITLISRATCEIRLVDEGAALSDIPFDRLSLFPSTFVIRPPLITRIALNIPDENKEWIARSVLSMESICFRRWKEADLVYSGATDLELRNFVCGDLFTKDTHCSLKKELERFIYNSVVCFKSPVLVQPKKPNIGASLPAIGLKHSLDSRSLRSRVVNTRIEESTILEDGRSIPFRSLSRQVAAPKAESKPHMTWADLKFSC